VLRTEYGVASMTMAVLMTWKRGEFNPPAEDIWTNSNASGAVVGTIGDSSYSSTFLKNLVLVRRIDSDCMISFLIL
jgi:hypothetical protein